MGEMRIGWDFTFQSHAGSIEAWASRDPLKIAEKGFNPTLVRLRRPGRLLARFRMSRFQSHAGSIEAQGPSRILSAESSFQSHAGSIEAGAPPPGQRPEPAPFQSHAGSIEAAGSTDAPPNVGCVSIPRWFD